MLVEHRDKDERKKFEAELNKPVPGVVLRPPVVKSTGRPDPSGFLAAMGSAGAP